MNCSLTNEHDILDRICALRQPYLIRNERLCSNSLRTLRSDSAFSNKNVSVVCYLSTTATVT